MRRSSSSRCIDGGPAAGVGSAVPHGAARRAAQQEGEVAQACRARLEELQAEVVLLSELREEMLAACAPRFTRHDVVAEMRCSWTGSGRRPRV